MPTIFGSLTALVLAVSLWLGMKNQAQYKKEIEVKHSAEKNLKREVKVLKKVTAQWQAAIDKKKTLLGSTEGLTEEVAELEAKISDIKEEIVEKEQREKQLEAEVLASNEMLEKVGGAGDLVPKIKGLRSEVAQLSSDIEVGTVSLNNLKQSKQDLQKSIATNEQRVELEASGKSLPTLKTTIKTVYTNWGFVTLNGGDSQGVVPGSILAVVRGGEVVAKLKVTTVEPNRAAADIMRSSGGDDVYLMSGDSVVAENTALAAPVKKVTAN